MFVLYATVSIYLPLLSTIDTVRVKLSFFSLPTSNVFAGCPETRGKTLPKNERFRERKYVERKSIVTVKLASSFKTTCIFYGA